jgi:hypothetical protein
MKLRAAVLAAATGLGLLLPATVASAEEAIGADTFDAYATAEAFRYYFGSPGFLVVERYADFGAPVAQASIDSLGRSAAFASDPFPGDTFVAGPGTLAGVTGLPNPGNYPFYVASSYPAKPDNTVEQPGYLLKAKSEETRSGATAQHGGASGDSAVFFAQATSAADYTPATGAVKAQSKALARQIDIGGVLKIGSMDTSATVSQTPGQEPVRESTFRVDFVSIAGQAVGISAKGLTVAGNNSPLPDGSPMVQALKSANISVQYLQAANQPGEVTSPGLLITQRFPVPQGPEMVSTLVLGRAVARVSIGDAVVGGSQAADSSGGAEAAPAPASSAAAPAVPVAPSRDHTARLSRSTPAAGLFGGARQATVPSSRIRWMASVG